MVAECPSNYTIGELDIFVQWEEMQVEETTWEEFKRMQFPNFHLKNKVKLRAGDIDKNSKCTVHFTRAQRKLRRSIHTRQE